MKDTAPALGDTAPTLAPPAAIDERELVRRIVARDQDAFESMMRLHNRRLYRLARATLGDAAEAEDALQEAYVSVYRSIGQFRGESSLLTWLSRLVRNECLGRIRRQARRQNVIPMLNVNALDDADIDAMAANNSEPPDHAFARSQMRALIECKLDALPEAFRSVFIMRSVEEMSIEETAQCLDIPQATVRSRHFRARSLLRESLSQTIDLAERDVFDFGGQHCNRIVARVLARIRAEEQQPD